MSNTSNTSNASATNTSSHSTWSVEDTLEIELATAVTALDVIAVAGDVAVRGCDGPARIEIRRYSGPPVEVELDGNGYLVIRHDARRGGWIRSCEATIRAAVPASAAVDVRTVSAPAVVVGIAAPAHVRTVSGHAVVDQLDGGADVETTSGDIEAGSVAGDLRMRTVSGTLTVVDGDCPSIKARSVSGDVTLDVRLGAGLVDLETVSGGVHVRVPKDSGLSVDVSTVSGALDTAFSLEHQRSPGRRHLHGVVGDGRTDLRASTVSGNFALLAREQLRTLLPDGDDPGERSIA